MKIGKIISLALLVWTGSMYSSCSSDEPIENEQPEVPADDEDDEEEGEQGGEISFIDYVTPQFTGEASVVTYSQTKSDVNGRPFLPLGVYGVNPNDMPSACDFGFNLVQSYQFFDLSTEKQREFLDAAQQNRLMVFAGLNWAGNAKATEEYLTKLKTIVNTFKSHPALYAWYLADEPYIATSTPEKLKEVYDWIKQADPNHPVISSNWELGNFKDCCDADMRQLYQGVPYRLSPGLEPYLERENKDIKTWVAIINSYDSGWGDDGKKSMNPTTAFDKLANAGFDKNSPEWKAEEEYWQPLLENLANPEAAGFYPSVTFPNTPEAVRSSFYWAFAHGSNGVYYWLYSNPEGGLNLRWGWYTIFFQPRLCDALRSTLSELKELSKFLVNPSEHSISFKDERYTGIYVWSKIIDRRRIVVIINETGSDFSGEIDLSDLYIPSRTLKVYKEDEREIKLDGNTLTESFKKDEVHVYFVN